MKVKISFGFALLFVAIILGCSAEGIQLPWNTTHTEVTSVCDQPEYTGSLICSALKATGVSAENMRDLILDANSIALITKAYTPKEVGVITAAADVLLNDPELTYEKYFGQMKLDYVQVQQISGIIDRRLGGLSSTGKMLESDRKLASLMNQRIREASGVATE